MAIRTEIIVWGTAPEGAVVAKAVLTVVGATTGTQSFDVVMGVASVDVKLDADSYTATIQAVDANGGPVGAPVTDTFTISTPAVYSIPLSMTGTTA